MTIEDQIAEEILNGLSLTEELADPLRLRIAAAIRKDRDRAARILNMAPLDMSLEQLATLINQG